MYNEMIQKTVQLIEEYNKDMNEDIIDTQKTISNIKYVGGNTIERLKLFSYEELQECFYINGGKRVPKILIKEIARLFRGDEKNISKKKVSNMSIRELIENFDPSEKNEVYDRLKKIAGNKKFILYEDNKIVADVTEKLLYEIKDGYDSRPYFDYKNGVIHQLYSVDEQPEIVYNENPLYPNRFLRPDFTCDQTGRSWQDVALEVMQLARIIANDNFKVLSIKEANDIIDIVVSNQAFEKLSKLYPNSALAFGKLKKIDKLPSLKSTKLNSSCLKNSSKVSFEKENK